MLLKPLFLQLFNKLPRHHYTSGWVLSQAARALYEMTEYAQVSLEGPGNRRPLAALRSPWHCWNNNNTHPTCGYSFRSTKGGASYTERNIASHITRAWTLSLTIPLHQATRLYQSVHQAEMSRCNNLAYYSTCLWHTQREVELSALAHQMLESNKNSPEVISMLASCCEEL